MPDTYTEMKILKMLIDKGDVSLLQNVVGWVASISCTEKRSTVFKKLVEKYVTVSSLQPNLVTNESVECAANFFINSLGPKESPLEIFLAWRTASRNTEALKLHYFKKFKRKILVPPKIQALVFRASKLIQHLNFNIKNYQAIL